MSNISFRIEPILKQIAILIGLSALVACRSSSAPEAYVTQADAAKIAETAEATFTTGDLSRIMGQYADNAVMIDASKPEPSADHKVATESARAFVSMKPQDYRVVGRHIQLLGPNAFVSSGIEQFTVAAGAARPTVSARFTDVFQRSNGVWKIVHEHVSMPPTEAARP